MCLLLEDTLEFLKFAEVDKRLAALRHGLDRTNNNYNDLYIDSMQIMYCEVNKFIIICDWIWETLCSGSVRDRVFSSSGRNLSKSRFCHIHVEQPF